VKRVVLAAAAAALAVPTPAAATRFAVGVDPAAPLDRVAADLTLVTGTSPDRSLDDLRALIVNAPSARVLSGTPGVEYVERLDRTRRLAFVPNDPLAERQWHLEDVHAFDIWPELPALGGPLVAVIDSGIDGGHPEFDGKIVAARSFVGGSALVDTHGHGTVVAGLIAAQTNNGEGIAGMAFSAQLLIAKVVRNRAVGLEAEARAIRWAVDNGARVINLSLGGVRDPRNLERDTFSPLEAAVIQYAYAHGAVIVAAAGNADQAPATPWPYASYPAALPHVVGVGAISRDGSVPQFSNRDPVYLDVAAPGVELVSTFPRSLTAARATCAEQGYTPCGTDEFRRAEGTSFAAPQVSAAAALVLSVRPNLRPDQVAALVTRHADDQSGSTGCARCLPGRDLLTGWGRLDVARSLAATLTPPAPDRFETNDDAGASAFKLWGQKRVLEATLDYWDDQSDVYGVFLRRGQRLRASLDGPFRADSNLVLWSPSARNLEQFSLRTLKQRLVASSRRGWRQKVVFRARTTGWHYLQAKVVSPRAGPYRLSLAKLAR
jgi:subtilisin family serine protease